MSVGDVASQERGSGARFNTGKPSFDLIPLSALEDCAKVFDYGRRKYADWNWAKGMAWSIPLGSLLRHLAAWQRGEDIDTESGLPHLGHIHCNLVMLSTYARTFPEGDDRAKKWLGGLSREHGEVEHVTDPRIAKDSADAAVAELLPPQPATIATDD